MRNCIEFFFFILHLPLLEHFCVCFLPMSEGTRAEYMTFLTYFQYLLEVLHDFKCCPLVVKPRQFKILYCIFLFSELLLLLRQVKIY